MEIPKNIEEEAKLDIFSKEELESSYSINNVNDTKDFNDFYNDTTEDNIDDSYIYEEDKANLLIACKNIVDKNYQQYPSPMDGIITKNLYYGCIKKLNKEEYLNEKKEIKKLNIVEQQLLKIKNNNKYIHNEKENEIMDINEFLQD
jgi:hypothetical protein|tara:strand:+ start:397 stop:834 length:438 start_codon:yes stop_codon:yes gene_type:complete